jgi:beta-galactosidase GanA
LPAHEARAHQVTYDHYSLLVDGRRVVLQGAEFHYWRLPSPDLWRDVLEKLKAGGFNAISVYFDWAYHSPKPGVYDFTGVRDVSRLLDIAEQSGLYVIARPGPYINAETTGGGFPAWLKTVPGRARSSDPGYTAAYQDWLGHVDRILAPHQVTHGGSVLMYIAENEYAVNTDAVYMGDIQARARADGIDVPIGSNDCCDAASWTSTWASGPGAVQVPGVDGYPQSFDCPNFATTWGPWSLGVTERLSNNAPAFTPEYQAGSIDSFNAGYDKCRALTGPSYMKFFYKSNVVASGATIFSYYMGYGGTSWGWLPQPNDVYTSYDYGAAITEDRQLTTKYDEFKRQGYFLSSVAPLSKTDAAGGPASDNPALQALARANPDTGTQFVLVRHSDRAASTDDSGTLDWTTPDGRYQVPVRVAGRDAKILVAGYDMGGQRLAWSSSEIMTHASIGGRDVAILYGTAGTAGSTVLRYSSAPTVRTLEGSASSSYDAGRGDLRLDYTHGGLVRVLITGGGRRPLLLLLGSDEAVASFWRVDTSAGPVLVRGTSLVRSATASDDGLALRADTAAPGEVEVFGPARRLSVNGRPVEVHGTPSGSLAGMLPGPDAVELPALTSWRYQAEAPEAAPGFAEGGWTPVDHTTTTSPYPPKTLPVLYADDYGFHYGNVWYRGRFVATGSESKVSLDAITGKRGMYMVWLNGQYLGWAKGGNQDDSGTTGTGPQNPDPGHGDFAIPPGLLQPGQQATLSVLVENMGHNDDWIADDVRFKQPRGLYAAWLPGSPAPISWKIQGALGGENLTDPARGPLNTGGLFGERSGWNLPNHPDRSWTVASPAATSLAAGGVGWYRTAFRLDLPRQQDVSVALRFGGALTGDHRVLIFLNGWNLGQYSADIGPQQDFVLPNGLLRPDGRNTLALAVIASDGVPGGLGPIGLVATANHWGGAPVNDVA